MRNALLFVCIATVWVALDQACKAFFDSGAYVVGQQISGPYLGIFQFTLVHNTGAAWGIFGDSTAALAWFSVIVCVIVIVFAFFLEPNLNLGCTIGLALVFAGGIGNAIDRFSQSYVVDFIDFSFMDFPVFNIADIGVTCGAVIFIVFYLIALRAEDKEAAAEGGKAASTTTDAAKGGKTTAKAAGKPTDTADLGVKGALSAQEGAKGGPSA